MIHSKAASPRSIRVLTSGIRNKIRRRSEDEDSGLDASEGDKSLGLGRGNYNKILLNDWLKNNKLESYILCISLRGYGCRKITLRFRAPFKTEVEKVPV